MCQNEEQGCPISPLLFSLFIEPLSQVITQTREIKGIEVFGIEQKLALFADDVLVYLGQPTQSLPALMNTLEEYGALSGYKLNIQKTQVITLNYDPPKSLRDAYKLNWQSNKIKYLGVFLP